MDIFSLKGIKKSNEEKVDLHNNAVEGLFLAEKELVKHAEKISVANHRIEDLEHMAKAGE